MKTGSFVHLIAVPYDSARRGERMGAGPDTLMPLLAARLREAGHRVQCLTIEAPAESWRAEIRTMFDLSRAVARAVCDARDTGAFPLVLSGNCGPAALGCVAAADTNPAVFWFDAHGDLNTPDTTIGGFLDGMALATVTGRCWPQLARGVTGFRPVDERSVALIGARDFDPLEAAMLQASGISHVEPASLGPELSAAIGSIATRRECAYLHLDLDVLDPSQGRVNGYAAAGGLSCTDVAWAIDEIRQSFYLYAASLTAFDPAVDADGRGLNAALALGVALVEAAPAIDDESSS
jgi:arginase